MPVLASTKLIFVLSVGPQGGSSLPSKALFVKEIKSVINLHLKGKK